MTIGELRAIQQQVKSAENVPDVPFRVDYSKNADGDITSVSITSRRLIVNRIGEIANREIAAIYDQMPHRR